MLDGIDGNVVIDFRGASRFGREAAKKLARALGPLGSEVSTCEIVGCPVEVALAMAENLLNALGATPEQLDHARERARRSLHPAPAK